jgi:hypothetical protein
LPRHLKKSRWPFKKSRLAAFKSGDLPELGLTRAQLSTHPKSFNRLQCCALSESIPLDKLFFAIMAGSLVFLLAMSAYIVSL